MKRKVKTDVAWIGVLSCVVMKTFQLEHHSFPVAAFSKTWHYYQSFPFVYLRKYWKIYIVGNRGIEVILCKHLHFPPHSLVLSICYTCLPTSLHLSYQPLFSTDRELDCGSNLTCAVAVTLCRLWMNVLAPNFAMHITENLSLCLNSPVSLGSF